MATANPFDLLGDDDNDDPSPLIAFQHQKFATKKPSSPSPAPAAAKLPSKPLPPAQAVRESMNNTALVGGSTGRGATTGERRDFGNRKANGYSSGVEPEDGESGKLSERGRGSYGRRGGFSNGDSEDRFDSERHQRRGYERRSGTGRGYEMKREGAGRGNWGTVTDDVLAQGIEGGVKLDEKAVASYRQPEVEEGQGTDGRKDKKELVNDAEEKETEDNEMTLEEYEKLREEKRKALLSMKAEERKVEFDKDFESMQQLSIKKANDEVFFQVASEKDPSKRREIAEKEERARKAMSINEFLKPAEGERYFSRGRGRGRGSFREGYGGGGDALISPGAPSFEDQGQFPALGVK